MRTGKGGSKLMENRYTIKLVGNSLTILISVFVNGVFVSEEVWSMDGV